MVAALMVVETLCHSANEAAERSTFQLKVARYGGKSLKEDSGRSSSISSSFATATGTHQNAFFPQMAKIVRPMITRSCLSDQLEM